MSTSKHNPDFSTYGDCSNEQYDPEWWFPVEKPGRKGNWSRTYEANAARSICASCPLLAECSTYALQYFGMSGIWGGMDRYERATMQKKLNITPISWETSYQSSTANYGSTYE